MNPNERLFSLDALRGFDMLFIMGFAGLVSSLCALWPNLFTDALAAQMHHVPWDGLTHHDTIFPLFLFIAGLSYPFSLQKQLSAGASRGDLYRKIIRPEFIRKFSCRFDSGSAERSAHESYTFYFNCAVFYRALH